MYIDMCICKYASIYIYTCVYMYKNICIYLYIYMHFIYHPEIMCRHFYIHTRDYLYIYICIYISYIIVFHYFHRSHMPMAVYHPLLLRYLSINDPSIIHWSSIKCSFIFWDPNYMLAIRPKDSTSQSYPLFSSMCP